MRGLSLFLASHSLRAPDGSCILTNSADNVLRVYNMPAELYSYNWDLLTEMVSGNITVSPIGCCEIDVSFSCTLRVYSIHLFGSYIDF